MAAKAGRPIHVGPSARIFCFRCFSLLATHTPLALHIDQGSQDPFFKVFFKKPK